MMAPTDDEVLNVSRVLGRAQDIVNARGKDRGWVDDAQPAARRYAAGVVPTYARKMRVR
jgi:hypothetical protein